MTSNFISKTNKDFSAQIIQNKILPHYNLPKSNIFMVKFKDTEKQRAVYKIEHNNKSYCLKKVYYDMNDLLYVYSAIEWLYRNNIRVPKLLSTIDNNRFVSYNDMLFILTPWVEGERCNFDNKNHVLIATKKLAEIHSISRNFTPILGSSKREGLDDYYISTKKHFEDLLNSSNEAFKRKDKFSKRFISYFDINLSLAKISLDISSKIDCDKLSKSLCHGDYVNKNLLFPQDLNPWLIDFDKCKMDYSVKDLSYFMRRLLKRENTKWDSDLAMSIIKTYNDKCNLTLSDFQYIIAYICFPQKYWKISRDYYKNIRKCNKASFLTLLSSATSKCSYQYEFALNIIDKVEREFEINII